MDSVHGYSLVNGWVAVMVTKLKASNIPCWADYPTLSEVVEQGSFTAWPINEIIYKNMGKSLQCKFNPSLLKRWQMYILPECITEKNDKKNTT